MNMDFIKENDYFVAAKKEKKRVIYQFKDGYWFLIEKGKLTWDCKEEEEYEGMMTVWDAPMWFREIYKKIKVTQMVGNKLRFQLDDSKKSELKREIFWTVGISFENGKEWSYSSEEGVVEEEAQVYLKECEGLFRLYDVELKTRRAAPNRIKVEVV